MNIEIVRTLSKSGKRVMFYATINGKRINNTNYARKWEAERLAKNYIEHLSK